eukprot:TRINITY_DN10827_c0_g1_i1.p1 TRINITY_DN10827_c0_g1~~TRINITY_DN10827_c0_g1_i1.p1  ORF type:complete len:286 (+),score=43.45 TRINITY_DN10827_c0_g1_i1:291-1148(+)
MMAVSQHHPNNVYKGSLSLGHLQYGISLVPRPNDALLKLAQESNAGREFPTSLEICGFFSAKAAPSPSIVSRHLLVPFSIMECTNTDEMNATLVHRDRLFCLALCRSLKCQLASAFVRLGSNWFGFLYAKPASSSASHDSLLLSILPPSPGRVEHPSIPFKYAAAPLFGLAELEVAPSVKAVELREELQTLLKSLRAAPTGLSQNTVDRCNHLQEVADLYCYPRLIDFLGELIQKELDSTRDATKREALSRFLDQVREHPLDQPYTLPPPKQKPKPGMSVMSILN